MKYYERVGNIHTHTTYSDGTGDHCALARAAAQAGLDFLITTDHNVYVPQHQGWYDQVLLLVGEEVHNPAAPHCNHYLIVNAGEEMASFGDDPQRLISAVRERGGLGFIAHPYEHSGAYVDEPEINWTAWGAQGYQGLEIWNYMSEFKSYLNDLPGALLGAFLPQLYIRGPYPETLAKWDELLSVGPVWAIGGADAHATLYRVGPLRRRVFSYAHLFGAVSTHLHTTSPWSGDVAADSRLVVEALRAGRAFVANDALAPARGFLFFAEQGDRAYTCGDEITARGPVHWRVQAPQRARLRLMLNGFCLAETIGTELEVKSQAPGAYRVEATRVSWFRERGWVYTNPIFLHPQRRPAV